MRKAITIPKSYEQLDTDVAIRIMRDLENAKHIHRLQECPVFTSSNVSYEIEVHDNETDGALTILAEAQLFLYSDIVQSPQEETASDLHMLNRHGFYIDSGLVIFLPDKCAHVSTYDWLRYVRLWSSAEIEHAIRGSITADRIALYRGAGYDKVDMGNVSSEMLLALWHFYSSKFLKDDVEIVNGTIPGEIGTEWEARESLGKLRYDTFYKPAL